MKWTRHAVLSCTVAPGNTSSLLRGALHGAYVTTLRPEQDQSYARSETNFAPGARQIYVLSEPPPAIFHGYVK